MHLDQSSSIEINPSGTLCRTKCFLRLYWNGKILQQRLLIVHVFKFCVVSISASCNIDLQRAKQISTLSSCAIMTRLWYLNSFAKEKCLIFFISSSKLVIVKRSVQRRWPVLTIERPLCKQCIILITIWRFSLRSAVYILLDWEWLFWLQNTRVNLLLFSPLQSFELRSSKPEKTPLWCNNNVYVVA